jgi:signal peptidase I
MSTMESERPEGETLPLAAEPVLPEPVAPVPAAEPGRLRGVWREWVRPFFIVLAVVCTFRSAVADWNDVPTGSMKPTILPGERIFVNKLAYDLKVPFSCLHTCISVAQWADPRRGDVVVLFSPADHKRLVKRVVGLPGDVVEMRRNRLFVNGEEARYTEYDEAQLKALGYLPEEPASQVLSEVVDGDEHPVLWISYAPVAATFPPTVVPEGKYFVMGDNRNQSRDSRWFGFVDRERIVGQATAVVVSFDKEHRYAPRWSRFFQGLP